MLGANIRANMTVGEVAAGNDMMLAQIESLAKGAKPALVPTLLDEEGK